MAVSHIDFAVNDSTETRLTIHGTDKRRGATVIITLSQHSNATHVMLGGTGLVAGTSYGIELGKGESITLSGWFTDDDKLYAKTTGNTGTVHVLIVGS